MKYVVTIYLSDRYFETVNFMFDKDPELIRRVWNDGGYHEAGVLVEDNLFAEWALYDAYWDTQFGSKRWRGLRALMPGDIVEVEGRYYVVCEVVFEPIKL